MVKAVDIKAALTLLPVRSPHTPDEEPAKAFATLADYCDGGVFAGSFDGYSEWERHRNGDELVHVLGGETTKTILTDDGSVELTLTAGMLTVVPQGLWHRFHAPDGVTLMTRRSRQTTRPPTIRGTTSRRCRRPWAALRIPCAFASRHR